MTSAYGYAQSIHATFLIPFYTDDFSSYTWDTNPTDIVNNYALRTPVFYAFQSLVQEYGIPPLGVPEFTSSVLVVAAASVVAVALIKRRTATATI
jgi:hypothetical protein